MDREGVKKMCDAGDLLFREALVYATAKDDKAKMASEQSGSCSNSSAPIGQFSVQRNKPFGKAWSGEHLKELRQNYGYAVAGELSRVGKPQ